MGGIPFLLKREERPVRESADCIRPHLKSLQAKFRPEGQKSSRLHSANDQEQLLADIIKKEGISNVSVWQRRANWEICIALSCFHL